jgi:antitoxin (DNA-binding transcriptional repressor) of toxin-antitoxin stability system
MTISAKELRFKLAMLFEALGRGEKISITYRGKVRAKLIPAEERSEDREDIAFGIWRDREEDVESQVREWRRGRRFDD